MKSEALRWARKKGLNCEQDLMAEQLRMQCRNQLVSVIIAAELLVLLLLVGC